MTNLGQLKLKDTEEKTAYVYGFQGGVNKLQDESLIDDHELSTAENAEFIIDGVKKRSGTLNYGTSTGSYVYGGTPFYTSATTNNRFIIREGGTSLIYYDATKTPQNITGATMTTGLRTEFVMARNALYVLNGTDPLVKVTIPSTIPVASTFTALTTPTGLTVTATGTTGAVRYSYRVSAVSASGETLACNSVTITNGNATLSSTNYNALSWTAVPSALSYNVYGRKIVGDNGIGETFMINVSVITYNDTGTDTPNTVIIPPEGNSTGGQKGTMGIYALSRLFISGDSTNPSRFYYSAGGTQIEDFSSAHTGGFVDVAKDDGDSVSGIVYYQNHIIIFKHRSIWQFDFTATGLPQLSLITNEIGCESFRSIRVLNNDLWFLSKKDGKAKIFTLGNVQNYFSALRTTEQSLKISQGSYLDNANLAQLPYACAYYYRNLYILCLASGASTTNDTCFGYDTRFSSFIGKWTGIPSNTFFSYTDASGNDDLYYCSETTGYIVKMFTGKDDNGSAINWKIQTKNFMQQYFDQYKLYRNPIFWFKDVANGSVTGYVITDGLFSSGAFNITPIVSGIGAGFDRPGTFKAGTSLGAATTSAKSDQPMEVIKVFNARSIKFELDDSNLSSDFKFLGLSYRWILLEGKPLPAANRIHLS